MILQLDDIIDILKCLYPQYDFLFLFDHSCGCNKQREDVFYVENMSKSNGGKQSFFAWHWLKKQMDIWDCFNLASILATPSSWFLNQMMMDHFGWQEKKEKQNKWIQ